MTVYSCSKDASAWKEGDAWSGWDDHHPVGTNQNGNTWRSFVYFPFSKGTHQGVASATLRMRYREGSGNHIAGDTNTCRIYARRMTSSWGEGTDRGENLWSVNESWDWSNRAGAYTTSGQSFEDVGNLSSGTWVEWDVTAIAQAWFNGSANYGIALKADDETEIGKEFGSRHLSGYVPELEVVWIDNVAPNAPTSLAPTGSTVVHTGPSLNVSGTRSDPDSGDYITAYQVQAFSDAATDAVPGTPLHDSGTVTVTGTPTTFSRSLAGFNGAYYKWRARTRDKSSVWGPWSLLQRVFVNSPPNAPGGMAVDTDTLTPTFSGAFTDPDTTKSPPTGGTPAEVEIEVQTNDGVTTKWASGPLANATVLFSKVYAGTALAFGTAYRWRARWKDNAGAWGAWSTYQTWTPVAPNGPDNLTPRSISVKTDTLTPTLTVAHSQPFVNYELEVRTPGSPTPNVWDPAVGSDFSSRNSEPRLYSGPALAWGTLYEWRAKVKLTSGGVWTAFSAWVPLYINAAPTAPTNLRIDGKPSGSVVTPARPTLKATFQDPDVGTYAESVDSSEHEVTRVDTGAHVGGSPILAFGEQGIPTADLPLDVPLRYRAHMSDGTVWGAWSDYATFKRSTAPTVGLTAPANASTVTISQPVLDWSFTGSGGKAQISYRVWIYDTTAGDVLVHDSGTVQSAATSYTVPKGVLQTGSSYRWEVDATDSDGLTTRLT